MDERGQAYALEGVIAVLVIALALVLGMQAVDIAPWTDEGDRQLDDLRTQAEDTLVTAEQRGLLDEVAVCVAGDGHSGDQGGVARASDEPTLLVPGVEPDIGFEGLLDSSLGDRMQFAVAVEYPTDEGLETASLTLQTPPDRPSATASARVTLSGSDEIRQGAACTPTGTTLGDLGDEADGEFYFDRQTDGDLYGVVTIRVVVW